MANITITIPDQHLDRVVHALSKAGGYDTENSQNARAALMAWIRATVRNIERAEAQQAALDALPEPNVDDVVEETP